MHYGVQQCCSKQIFYTKLLPKKYTEVAKRRAKHYLRLFLRKCAYASLYAFLRKIPVHTTHTYSGLQVVASPRHGAGRQTKNIAAKAKRSSIAMHHCLYMAMSTCYTTGRRVCA